MRAMRFMALLFGLAIALMISGCPGTPSTRSTSTQISPVGSKDKQTDSSATQHKETIEIVPVTAQGPVRRTVVTKDRDNNIVAEGVAVKTTIISPNPNTGGDTTTIVQFADNDSVALSGVEAVPLMKKIRITIYTYDCKIERLE